MDAGTHVDLKDADLERRSLALPSDPAPPAQRAPANVGDEWRDTGAPEPPEPADEPPRQVIPLCKRLSGPWS